MSKYESLITSGHKVEYLDIRTTSSMLFYNIHQWLKSEIGDDGEDWRYQWRTFYFKHEEDKVKFILRWA